MGESKEHQTDNYGKYHKVDNDNSNEFGYPRTILTQIPVINNLSKDKSGLHPTQKPVALMEYLIKTYTNDNEIVLDFTAGSFTTAIACMNTKRNFIGIEKDNGYFNIGVERVAKHKIKLEQDLFFIR
jgi:site-specific DNA-methyltransferase (adenine-specific)